MDLESLNKEQLEAVKHTAGPLLVVAGAGTGKTQVITQRIRYLLDNKKVPGSNIVALTFTEKAAEEMETRLSELRHQYTFDVSIMTFNAFGHKLLQRFAHDIGLNPNFKVLTNIQQIILLKEYFDELKLAYYAPIARPDAMLGELIKYFSKLKNDLITVSDYKDFIKHQFKVVTDKADELDKARHQELLGAFEAYLKITRRINAIDMDDQIYLLIELFNTRPNVLKKVQAEIDYILVDEYQDTNFAQGQLLDLLAAKKQNIMVVGDDDQCIYNFRGAAISNILAFKERYKDAKQLTLLENYRSSQNILDSAYNLIQHNNPNRLEAKYHLNKRLKGQFSGKKPQLKSFMTHEEEAAWVASDIKKRLQAGQDPDQIAILLRKNQQATDVKRYLDAQEVPYIVLGEVADLYQQPSVKLLIDILKIIVDPKDSESMYRVLASGVYTIQPSNLRYLVSQSKRQHIHLERYLSKLSADNTEDIADKELASINQLLTQLVHWRSILPKVSVGKLAYQILEHTGYLKALLEQAKEDPSVDNAIAALNSYFVTLLNFERIAQDNTAVGYINSLGALEESGQFITIGQDNELLAPKVHVLTIHKAKGLEFEVVYIFDLSQGTFPSRRVSAPLEVPQDLQTLKTAEADTFLEEERRLMYVAMTRAKNELMLTYAADHGGARIKKPSIFIEEALGLQPELAQYQQKASSTDQIALFKDKVSTPDVLPPTLMQGDTVILNAQSITDYLMCPAEFRFRYIINPPLPVTFAMEYGTLLHTVVQYYNHRKITGARIEFKELLEVLESNWPKEGFISSGHGKRGLDQARATVERFYKREQANTLKPTYVEKPFSVRLNDIKTVINGRFDAIFQIKEGVEIRDYKTGAASVTSQQKADQRTKESLQLSVYALGWKTLEGEAPIRLSLDFIDAGYVGSTVKTERQLENTKLKVQTVAEGIRAGNFSPKGSHIFCTHQEYGL